MDVERKNTYVSVVQCNSGHLYENLSVFEGWNWTFLDNCIVVVLVGWRFTEDHSLGLLRRHDAG